ncbi:MAG: hypothetical protein U1E65_18340 [Myxococcota bacterium]
MRGALVEPMISAELFQVTLQLIDRRTGETTAQRAFPTGDPSPEIKRFSAPFAVRRSDGGAETHWVYVSIMAGRRVRAAGGAKNADPEQLVSVDATLHDGRGTLGYSLEGRYDIRIEVAPKLPSVAPPPRPVQPPRTSAPEGAKAFFERVGLQPRKQPDERVIVRRVARSRW